MPITTCTVCGSAYDAGSEEQANERERFCGGTRCKRRQRSTLNYFGVSAALPPGSDEERIVSLVLGRIFTKDEALNLAAWLAVMSGESREELLGLIDAIENT